MTRFVYGQWEVIKVIKGHEGSVSPYWRSPQSGQWSSLGVGRRHASGALSLMERVAGHSLPAEVTCHYFRSEDNRAVSICKSVKA